MNSSSESQINDPVNVLVPNDMDVIEDIHEEPHHRRSSYHHEDNESELDSRRHESERDGYDQDRDRRHKDNVDDHPLDEKDRYDRDNKYDVDNRQHGRSGTHRSRSRSPTRKGNGSNDVRDRRVYIGNLSYDVKWTHLKDFMREIGPVAHADVLLGRDGRSKGCGVVEYQFADDARTAIRKLNDIVLMGRPVFVREDREPDTRIGFSGGKATSSRRESGPTSGASGRQVYVGNLPYSINWKDLKDLFRRAGAVDRADVFMTRDNHSKGSGTISFESSYDVGRAISMFNGHSWHGRRIEVREDKFGPPTGGSSRSTGPPAPSSRHHPRDYDRGDSYVYGHNSSRTSRGHDIYSGSSSRSNYRGSDIDMADIPSGPAADSGHQIHIRNLPLTTTDQDLKDLFRICGPIRMAQMLDSGSRSSGSGIVRFEMFDSAHRAVVKFNGYVYGGRSLDIAKA
ncbi:hypothetical protein BGZ76_000065 [Entomortierella beljakovae]|nr:hypothetical protein BGZ76_000065 [Entomortierella beljakovae]